MFVVLCSYNFFFCFCKYFLCARLLRFVFYVVRISDQGFLGVYSQSHQLDIGWMLRLHSDQPCPQDYCTNIQ